MPDSTLDPQPVYRIRVAVPVYLYDCFDYMLSAAQYQQAEVGARVLVSFWSAKLGRNYCRKTGTRHPN